MTRTPEELFKPLSSVTLSASERTRMRAELAAFADLHTLPTPAPKRSPFAEWRMLSRAFAVLLLMVGVVGGSAYASSDALPGDPLYAVKLSIAEPLQATLIPTKEGKAAWHAVLAERRLEEAAKLAVEGKLDAELETAITQNFAVQVERSLALSDELREEGNAEAALLARSDLEARVTAHEAIVSFVAAHVALQGTETPGVARILAAVEERRERIAAAREADEVVVARADTSRAAALDPSPEIPEVARMETMATMMIADESPSDAVSNAREVREQEVSAILMKHASFLNVLATTTATSTATTTATTTPEEIED